jgi:hypothetical protein
LPHLPSLARNLLAWISAADRLCVAHPRSSSGGGRDAGDR